MLTKELITELAVNPYLRAAYIKSLGNERSKIDPLAHPEAVEGSWQACVGCCDPGSDPIPESISAPANEAVKSVGSRV